MKVWDGSSILAAISQFEYTSLQKNTSKHLKSFWLLRQSILFPSAADDDFLHKSRVDFRGKLFNVSKEIQIQILDDSAQKAFKAFWHRQNSFNMNW
jgi:hypothetical protein